MSAPPTVEALVPTSRPTGLRRLLHSLAGQEGADDWSVLVVDNHPERLAEAVVAEVAPDVGLPIRYTHEARRGVSHARNHGMSESDSEIVVLLDDDVVVQHPSWLARLLRPLQEGAVAAGGPVRLDPRVALPGWLDDDLRGYLTELDLGPTRRPLRDGEYLLTANLAARRDALRAVGGFNPMLGPRPGTHLTNDDLDISRRLAETGGSVIWVPDAAVVHDVPRQRLAPRWLLQRILAQGRSDYLLDRERLREGRFNGVIGRTRDALTLIYRRARHGGRGRSLLFRSLAELAQLAGYLREAVPDLMGRGMPR